MLKDSKSQCLSRWVDSLLLGVTITLFTSSSSLAHFDKPGPPPILVNVHINQIVYATTSSPFVTNDGFDHNSEFLVLHFISQLPVHPESQTNGTTDDDAIDGPVWNPNELVYGHEECTELANIAATFPLALLLPFLPS